MMRQYEDGDGEVPIGNTDPKYLIRNYFPEAVPLTTRVTLATAIRNPDWSHTKLSEFLGVGHDVPSQVTEAFWRGTLEARAEGESGAWGESVGRSGINDYTTKQQAVIEFLARWPDVVEERGWSWPDVARYVAAKTGVDMTPSWARNVGTSHEEFIEEHRERLRKNGKLEELEEPEKPEKPPYSLRDRLVERVPNLPDDNLDDNTEHGEVLYDGIGWAAEYQKHDLVAANESRFPHAPGWTCECALPVDKTVDDEEVEEQLTDEEVEEELEELEELGDDMTDELTTRAEEHVQTARENASYSGPAEGIDATEQYIGEAPHWAREAEEEPEVAVRRESDGAQERVRPLDYMAPAAPADPSEARVAEAVAVLDRFVELARRERSLTNTEANVARQVMAEQCRDAVVDILDYEDNNE